MPKFILTFVIIGLVSGFASADIYSWKNASGNTVYSDQRGRGKVITETTTNSTDYYSVTHENRADRTVSQHPGSTADSEQQHLATITSSTDLQQSPPTLTESECQQQYQLSCERVNNWKTYAIEACGDQERCGDDAFLDRKYRPRSIEEMQTIANRSAIRNNLQERKIALFLTKKYTNYCANQAAMVCQNRKDAQCAATLRSYCDDDRDLKDIFQRYDNLTALEKQQIIRQAKALAAAGGENQLGYGQIVASLIELLISQASLGL